VRSCTVDESRVLTNLILEQGLKTICQRKAWYILSYRKPMSNLSKYYYAGIVVTCGKIGGSWPSHYDNDHGAHAGYQLLTCFFSNLRYPLIYISPGLIVALVLDPLIVFQMIVAIGFMASSMHTSHFCTILDFFLCSNDVT